MAGEAELDEADLQARLARRLAGPHESADAIVWVRDGSETVVHLDSLAIELRPGALRVSVDLETDETGRAAQEVLLALAAPDAPPDLLVVADENAHGDVRLGARWASTLQDAVWDALLAVADEEVHGRAGGLAAGEHRLLLQGEPVR